MSNTDITDADKLEALILNATDSDLADDGRYFQETCDNFSECAHGDCGEYSQGTQDGKLVEFLWNNRVKIQTALASTTDLQSRLDKADAESMGGVWQQARDNHERYSATGDTEQDIRFFTLGLAGEGAEVLEAAMLVAMRTGKLADKAKKRWRDEPNDAALIAECADVFAYNILLADALGLSPADLIAEVARKQQVFIDKMKARDQLTTKEES